MLIMNAGSSVLPAKLVAMGRVRAACSEGPATNEAPLRISSVSLSSAGKALAANETSRIARTATQEAVLRALGNDTPEQLEVFAFEMAQAPSRVMFDISRGDIRLASTGELVGEDDVARLEQLLTEVDAQQRSLYEDHKARGSAPEEIIAGIIDFRNAQSSEYRRATAWGYF